MSDTTDALGLGAFVVGAVVGSLLVIGSALGVVLSVAHWVLRALT